MAALMSDSLTPRPAREFSAGFSRTGRPGQPPTVQPDQKPRRSRAKISTTSRVCSIVKNRPFGAQGPPPAARAHKKILPRP